MFENITIFLKDTVCGELTVAQEVIDFFAVGITLFVSVLPFVLLIKLIARWF